MSAKRYFSGYEKDIAEMDLLTLWKIKRIVIAKRFGVMPEYIDTLPDAPDFAPYIDIRAHQLEDMIKVWDGARLTMVQHGTQISGFV